MIYNDDVNLNEGSETPRALLGQIFSTLFNIAAWADQWVDGGGRDDGGHGQDGGAGQEQDDGGDQNSLTWKPVFWGESWSSSAKSDKGLVHLFYHSLSLRKTRRNS